MRSRDGKRLELELWGVEGDRTSQGIIEEIAKEWNSIGVSTLPQSAPPDQLWGPLGYQYSDRMTGCLYTWTNANDPDDLFYWHSSQIPTSPGGSGGNLPAFFYPFAFQDDLDSLTVDAASELDLGRRQESVRRDPGAPGEGSSRHFSLLGTGLPRREEQRRGLLAERLGTAALERRGVVSRQRRSLSQWVALHQPMPRSSSTQRRHIP